jgi:hypothetical protein
VFLLCCHPGVVRSNNSIVAPVSNTNTIWSVKENSSAVFRQALCGCRVNNAVGKQLLTREGVDSVVRTIGRGGDAEGTYSAEVLHFALQNKVYRFAGFRARTTCGLPRRRTVSMCALDDICRTRSPCTTWGWTQQRDWCLSGRNSCMPGLWTCLYVDD